MSRYAHYVPVCSRLPVGLLSLELYREAKTVKLPHHLKDQLLRAASSICLNLAEGSAKPTAKDRARFYAIAFGSCREVQSVIQMENEKLGNLYPVADRLGGFLYKLCRS